MINDDINGTFEFLGGIALWSNVWRLWRDRRSMGVNWQTTVFFTTWGLWNCFYYPSLGQTFSFLGGLFICSGNLAWVSLLWYLKNATPLASEGAINHLT